MSVFDSLGVSLTNAGKIVSQKAKNTTEATSLSNKQRKERRNIQDCYLEIGKLYFDLRKNAPDPEFADLIHSIIASEERIEELQSEIDNVRLREPELISEMPAPATNRSSISVTKPSAMVCLQCGKSHPASLSYCPDCGIQLAAQYANAAQAAAAPAQKAAAPAPAPVIGVPAEPAPKPEKKTPPKRFCPYCGTNCEPDHIFCPECGEKL